MKPSRRQSGDWELRRGVYTQILNDFIYQLKKWRGWDPDSGDPIKRWIQLYDDKAHQTLIHRYWDYATEFEELQRTYMPVEERRRRRWTVHVPKTLRQSASKHASSPDQVMYAVVRSRATYGVSVGFFGLQPEDDPVCRDDFPIAVWLRCPFLCKACVDHAIADLRDIQRRMRASRIAKWDDLGSLEQDIVHFFLNLPKDDKKTYVAREVAEGIGRGYEYANVRRALPRLVDGNILAHHGERGGYSFLNRPRRMPKP